MKYSLSLADFDFAWSIQVTLKGMGTYVVAQLVKNLPAVQETWIQSLDWEDPRMGSWFPHKCS